MADHKFYGYDPTGQLTSVSNSTNATYTYDPVGNRQNVTGAIPGSGTYLADALNRYTAAPGGGAAYDPRGNLVAHAGRTLGYDSRNRLVSATVAGHTVTTTYDHRNRAVKRTVDGTATYFVWDDWSLIAEFDASGAVLQRYIQGPGIDNLVAKINAAGTVYYHQDGLGSTVALTDAAGTLVEGYTYDAFGAVRILDPSTLATRPTSLFSNRFIFTGREWLSEVGLYDYRNRAYDPELGRFLQTDPIRFDAGDVNLFRYVGNNPVNWIDPLGLQYGGGDYDYGVEDPTKLPWSPPSNPPTCFGKCCSKAACLTCCFTFIGVSQTACSKIPHFVGQAICRSVTAALGYACIKSCESCELP